MKQNKINIKPIKNLPKGWDKEVYLHIGALFEDIRFHFKVFCEQLAMINHKLDIIIKELGIIKKELIQNH